MLAIASDFFPVPGDSFVCDRSVTVTMGADSARVTESEMNFEKYEQIKTLEKILLTKTKESKQPKTLTGKERDHGDGDEARVERLDIKRVEDRTVDIERLRLNAILFHLCSVRNGSTSLASYNLVATSKQN